MTEGKRVRSERVERRMAATRERIIAEATRLFVEQGFEETSVAQITKAADIGKGTFFTYFPSKHAVLAHLSEQVTIAMISAADACEEEGCAARLRAAFKAAELWFEDNSSLAKPMCIARLSTISKVEQPSFRNQLLAFFATLLAEGIKSGEFRSLDIRDGVGAIASAYFMPVAAWALEAEDSSHPAFSGQLDIVLGGLKAKRNR